MNNKNVLNYTFGNGVLSSLPLIISDRRKDSGKIVVYFMDIFFKDNSTVLSKMQIQSEDVLIFQDTTEEPTTQYINKLTARLATYGRDNICAIIGMGGGITMDVAKAVSNLLTNSGKSEDYQGWDLVKNPGTYKIAIPTLSGTGSEATRTCVMTNTETGLKLGMNSNFTVYDQLILDPELTKTVPKNQYFYTGMDAYIHCIESLNGSYRNAIGDAYSNQTIHLCREVFLSDDMMNDENRSKLMVASYLGGCAIATSYVGIVHPFSAGLSVVLGIHHCIANCIVMRAMEEFYPNEFHEFWKMVDQQGVEIPEGICKNLSDKQYDKLSASTIIHETLSYNQLV